MKKFMSALLVVFPFLAFGGASSIYGNYDLQNVSASQNQIINKLANGVCALEDNDGNNCCTGFFIAKDKIMTNYHCLNCLSPKASANPNRFMSFFFGIPGSQDFENPYTNDFDVLNETPKEFTSIKIQLKAEEKRAEEGAEEPQNGYAGTKFAKVKKILAGAKKFDFLILEVESPEEDVKIHTLSESLPTRGMELMTIGYPGQGVTPVEKVYDVSVECKVSHASIQNFQGREENFGHQCDTDGGSSGSPIFERETQKVIGLHWAGGAERATRETAAWQFSKNLAVPMGSIVRYLRENHSELLENLKVD